jgi:hypothetical protein
VNFHPQKWTTFPKETVKIGLFGGVFYYLFFIGILLFLLVRTQCKNLKSYDNPFWGKSEEGKKKKKRKGKITTFVCASSHGQRTHYAQTKKQICALHKNHSSVSANGHV